MAEKLLAVFDLADDALEALRALQHQGFSTNDATLMSAQPVPGAEELGLAGPASRIGVFAISGGVLGAAAAVSLTVGASKHIGLITGGMPVVSPWPFAIIVFELTMLGAIVGTLVRMLFESKLARPGALDDYDPAVSDGKFVIALSARSPQDRSRAEKVLALHHATIKPGK